MFKFKDQRLLNYYFRHATHFFWSYPTIAEIEPEVIVIIVKFWRINFILCDMEGIQNCLSLLKK